MEADTIHMFWDVIEIPALDVTLKWLPSMILFTSNILVYVILFYSLI